MEKTSECTQRNLIQIHTAPTKIYSKVRVIKYILQMKSLNHQHISDKGLSELTDIILLPVYREQMNIMITLFRKKESLKLTLPLTKSNSARPYTNIITYFTKNFDSQFPIIQNQKSYYIKNGTHITGLYLIETLEPIKFNTQHFDMDNLISELECDHFPMEEPQLTILKEFLQI